MRLRLVKKETLEEIAGTVDMSVNGVKKVIYKYIKNIDKQILKFKKNHPS